MLFRNCNINCIIFVLQYCICNCSGSRGTSCWSRLITSCMRKRGDNYALVIKGVELKEAGKYTVKATNEVGSLDAMAKLKVTGMITASRQ